MRMNREDIPEAQVATLSRWINGLTTMLWKGNVVTT